MNPSAHSAQPEAELSEVMTTGMSAPPIDWVTCAPRKAEVTPAKASSLRARGAGVSAEAKRVIACEDEIQPCETLCSRHDWQGLRLCDASRLESRVGIAGWNPEGAYPAVERHDRAVDHILKGQRRRLRGKDALQPMKGVRRREKAVEGGGRQ